MARESAITFEQVSVAAETIKAQGGKANSRTVREVLGTGSMATILKYLQQWQGGQSRQSQAIDDTLDPAVVRSISNHIADKVQTATSALTIQITEQQTEMDSLISENERQAAELETLTTSFNALQDQHNQLSGVVKQLEAEAARTAAELVSERQAAEAARIQLAKAELRLEAVPRIEKEIEQVRGELATAQKQAAELHETAAVANAKLEAASLQRKEIDVQVTDLKTALKDALAQIAIEQEKNKTIAADQAAALTKQVTATHAAETRAAAAEATTKAQAEKISTLDTIIEKLQPQTAAKPAPKTKPTAKAKPV